MCLVLVSVRTGNNKKKCRFNQNPNEGQSIRLDGSHLGNKQTKPGDMRSSSVTKNLIL